MFRETECRESIPRLSKEDGGGPYAGVPRNLKDHARDRSEDPQSLSKEERDQGRVGAPECGRKLHKSSRRHNRGHGWSRKGREQGPERTSHGTRRRYSNCIIPGPPQYRNHIIAEERCLVRQIDFLSNKGRAFVANRAAMRA